MTEKNDIAIRVNNLSKCYQIYEKPHQRLFQGFLGSKTQRYKEFWALRDVSFEIKKGETVGIIGRNGSGKSTLLQMICGTLTPTAGSVETYGRIAALLELGSGFNPEFTGRENVYLNASVLGLTNDEINTRYDDIVAFADIGNFIEQPVKTYSSGMLVRLAFAVQVSVEPDILIVDEALSVGDFFFQQKCFGRIRELSASGVTLLFVSHDMGTVRDLCSTALYLLKGETALWGDSKDALRAYHTEGNSKGTNELPFDQSCNNLDHSGKSKLSDLSESLKFSLWRAQDYLSEKQNANRLLGVVARDKHGDFSSIVDMGDKLLIQIFFQSIPIDELSVSLVIKNKYDQIVSCVNSRQLGLSIIPSLEEFYSIVEFEIDCRIEAGLYSLKVNLGKSISPNKGEMLDNTDWFGPLQVNWDYESKQAPFLGMFGLPIMGKVIQF